MSEFHTELFTSLQSVIDLSDLSAMPKKSLYSAKDENPMKQTALYSANDIEPCPAQVAALVQSEVVFNDILKAPLKALDASSKEANNLYKQNFHH